MTNPTDREIKIVNPFGDSGSPKTFSAPSDLVLRPNGNGKAQGIPPSVASGFIHRYLVTLSDIDQFKHMSFANYVRLLFVSSDSLFLKHLGPGYPSTHRMNLICSKLQFKRQTVAGDQIDIRIYDGAANGSNLPLYFEFFLGDPKEVVAEGFQMYQIVDPSTKRLLEPSADILKMIDAIRDVSHDQKEAVELLSDADWRPGCEIYIYNAFRPFFKHTDFYGAVHPFYFAEWTSHVREAFFSEKCSDFRNIIESEIAMMTSKIIVTLMDDSRFADPIQARLTVTRVKKFSFDVVIRYWNERLKGFVAYTRHTLVFADPKTKSFAPIPNSIRESIGPYVH